jgi:CheY-like chemotaxis protein
MDVDLPEMKGFDAVPILEKISPDIKIIMTTKRNSKEQEAKVREQNIFYYFIKSFNKEELKMALASALKKKEVHKMKNGRKIMVIDDDPDFREAVTAILESADYEVVTVDGPKKVKDTLLAEKPNLILLDIMMDSLFDGFSLCHQIKTGREYEAFKRVPIIFCSAVKEQTGSRFEFKGGELGEVGMAGPDGYIDKPVKPNDLLARIERLLDN